MIERHLSTYIRFTLVAAVCCLAVPAAGGDRPNLLLIIADDLNWRDLGCTGSPDVHSPNIDKLASEGMTLRSMFTPAPTCSPTRHALYTGLFPVRSGAYPNHTMVAPTTHSVFTYLAEAGYRVGLQAKSHVSPKESFPFENISGDADNFDAFRSYVTRDSKQPWMAVYASHHPHGPWNSGPKKLYDPDKITVPKYLHDNATTRKLLAAYFAEITALDEQVGQLMRVLDETGQASNTLVLFVSEQGSSFPYGGKWSLYDNGIHAATFARWSGKIKAGSSNDALMQYVDVTPTFLAAAGIDPTKIDTGCKDANGKTGFDGLSFLDILLGKSSHLRDYVFAEHTTVGIIGYKEPYPIRAVRDTRYKYICNLAPQNVFTIGGIHRGDPIESWQDDSKNDPKLAARVDWLFHRPAEELYDVESDPFETKNLVDDSQFADIKSRLAQRLDAWMTQQGDRGMATELEALKHQPKHANDDVSGEGDKPKKEKTKKGKKKAKR